ncbi:GmrSD restriction endonuclease domain-containing protein [Pseudobacillus badius]|uniref:GmrSD restriction endonuclease domain-containing protein n=1 Tax=Bacillus badius TaxID=1455 RepID=UPI0007B05E8E|nr:DUF262 domain-containing protein [Bacillus badius]KZN99709.1 hypothetical protein A4244_17075 [Bacillus badius]OCS85813.1 hypothetical protein A6M11_17090 [Bacillus badius]OVE51829.1 hypothetical protein B1A98_09740 [Bacillus badius]TDW03255.1 HNH endonuclease [Bacillus badius]
MTTNIVLKEKEILNIFKENLKIESKVMTIDTLFYNPRKRRSIKENPYYQRNYVWDEDKATYFIESILLGTEIPPLVFFSNNKRTEVIDGRQRFETIERFIQGKFHLTSNGLRLLKDLQKKTFNDLNADIQDILWDTTIRIIEFGVIKNSILNEQKEDFIKKEIFRRYNSGITPLQRAEVDKAYYINNDINEYFKSEIIADKYIYSTLLDLFFSEREQEKINDDSTLEKVMLKTRSLLVLHQIPIRYYASSKAREETKKVLFEILTNNITDAENYYKGFTEKIELLDEIKAVFSKRKKASNRLIFESLFWALNVCEMENVEPNKLREEQFINDLVKYIAKNINNFANENSHFAKETVQRHVTVAEFFEQKFSIDFSVYIDNSKQFKQERKELFDMVETDANKLSELETLRLNRPDAKTITIEDIIRQMMRNRFLIRPAYQRGEAINRAKSSSIIESILLGIQLPPLFIYKRVDGTSEVIDGQQRLLSILGYIGQSFMNESGDISYSEKNEYKLHKLKFFKDIEGAKFNDLPEELRNTIFEFNLSIVTIDAKTNPNFDPIDLFIRLNNKPFPIRENTFEMWNSYVDKEIISYCKEKAAKYAPWFYVRLNNKRMENEELFLVLAYFDYRHQSKNHIIEDYLDIYQQTDKINARIKDKGDITRALENALEDEEAKKRFMRSLKSTDAFIKKVQILLSNDQAGDDIEPLLKNELEKTFSVRGNSRKRTLQNFYLLWYIMKDCNQAMILSRRAEINKEVFQTFDLIKNSKKSGENELKQDFEKVVKKFWKKFNPDKRSITLSAEEKNYLIQAQNQVCPLCQSTLSEIDEIEVDHIVPLSVGGRDGIGNLQITHKICNREKRNRLK